MSLLKSWVASANDPNGPFPLNNLPYGVFSTQDAGPRCGVAIGTQILDVQAAVAADLIGDFGGAFDAPHWNDFMALGIVKWNALRSRLTQILAADSLDQTDAAALLVPQTSAHMHLPITVSEYTDFYAGKNHAVNVGTMFRGAQNALPPNWLHMPIGYNGRASSVVVSGTEVRRPWGQIKGSGDAPQLAPSARFDIELEIGAIVGQPSTGSISVDQADRNIFGYVLLNDWSARDIQAWEYQPLGPFQAKATATTISPWIVTTAALALFRVTPPRRDVALLPHLADTDAMHFDVDLMVTLQPQGGDAHILTRTNTRELYYSAAQQLAHHTSSGCPMRVGDLLGSGTISGQGVAERGSLLEMSWNGEHPISLPDGTQRTFIEDGDTLGLVGVARGDGYRIGFGDCSGKVFPAAAQPFSP